MLNQDEIQEKIALTPTQKKAFDSLVRSVKKCRNENILFYQCLNKLGGLNGNNVDRIVDSFWHKDPRNLQFLNYPFVEIEDSWADDNHFVVLK
jgi:hypothetical protein